MKNNALVKALLRAAAITSVAASAWMYGSAETISQTGTLANPEDTVLINLPLISGGSVNLQTYGFGGGTNAAGTVIAPGGFDPFIGIFSGTGSSAVFLNGTSDILANYSDGCPPAGTVTIGGIPGQCGDVNLQLSGLGAGDYTILLTDAAYLPYAAFEDSGTLGDGFVDLTGAVFQTCYDANDCNTDSSNWALDITTSANSTPPPVPEPPSAELVCLAVASAGAWMYRRDRRTNRSIQGGSR